MNDKISKTDKENINKIIDHIYKVRCLLHKIVSKLLYRADNHDQSKLDEPELSIYVQYIHKLAGSTYGSDEYKQFLKDIKPALDHHYKHNRHHPEHFSNGINGMHLVDLMEMVCDWVAASKQHDNGDPLESLKHNINRFGIEPQLEDIIKNTIIFLKDL